MALYGNRYVQAGDPSGQQGFIGVGSQWQDTTSGKLYERTSDNSAWKLIYVVDQDRGGLLPVTGGSVTGAILGTTGWAPVDSPNFNTSAKLGGVDLATVNYVNSIATGLSDSISAQINQAVASTVGNTQINANIAKQKGYFAPTVSGAQSMTVPQTLQRYHYLNIQMAVVRHKSQNAFGLHHLPTCMQRALRVLESLLPTQTTKVLILQLFKNFMFQILLMHREFTSITGFLTKDLEEAKP